MNKKVLLIMLLFAVIASAALFAFAHSNQDFDGHFTMDVPFAKHYSDVAYCWPNGGLGCKCEYWEDGAGCDIEDGDIVIYYYNNSLLVEGESNAFEHAVNGLTTSYFYQIVQNDGDLIVLANDVEMRRLPPFLVGKSSPNGDEVVFVGGRNLDNVKRYANSIEFK
ncbi:MAG: hypothetical protein IJF83_06685 [Methanobrevibacter sp.]|nr:hypothetical protein [Methanobrevibacter sp.]